MNNTMKDKIFPEDRVRVVGKPVWNSSPQFPGLNLYEVGDTGTYKEAGFVDFDPSPTVRNDSPHTNSLVGGVPTKDSSRLWYVGTKFLEKL